MPEFVYPTKGVSTKYFTSNKAVGGPGGSPFYFVGLERGALLTKIRAWKDGFCIRGIEVKLSDGKLSFVGRHLGNVSEFEFKKREKITDLVLEASEEDGTETGWRRLGAISMTTDRGRKWNVTASNIPKNFSYSVPVGSGICCGVFGSSGWDIDRLGFAMLHKVEKSLMTDVVYPNLDQQLVNSTPEVVARQVFSNGTSVEQKFQLSGSKTVTIKRDWGITAGLSLAVSSEVSAGIPEVVSAKAGSTWKVSVTGNYSKSNSTTQTDTWTWPLDCPPHTQIEGTASIFQDEVSTEYNAEMELTLDTGAVVTYKVNGMYEGLNARAGNVSVRTVGAYKAK